MEDKEGNWWPDSYVVRAKTYKESKEIEKLKYYNNP